MQDSLLIIFLPNYSGYILREDRPANPRTKDEKNSQREDNNAQATRLVELILHQPMIHLIDESTPEVASRELILSKTGNPFLE
jgi:hypothetical protein